MGVTAWGYMAIVCVSLSRSRGLRLLIWSERWENDLTCPARKNIQLSNYQTIADALEFPLITIT